jgi:outer membrane murein-binding lipoprotein Lpp
MSDDLIAYLALDLELSRMDLDSDEADLKRDAMDPLFYRLTAQELQLVNDVQALRAKVDELTTENEGLRSQFKWLSDDFDAAAELGRKLRKRLDDLDID